jgi:hypothetical protein
MFFFGIVGWVVIIVDMILIFLKVRAVEKRVLRYSIGGSNDTFKRTRQTGIQALLYIGSYFITFISVIIWGLPMPISNPTALLCLIKITLPMQGFWNALIYMYPYYQTYSKQKQKRRSQKEIQQASPDLAAINNTDGKSCPPSMESSDKATGGEVPPTTFPSSWILEQSEKFAMQPEEGTEQVVDIGTTTSGRLVSIQSGATTTQPETLEQGLGTTVEVGRYAQRNPSDLCSRRGKKWSKGEDVYRW